jgi:signal transduction histidine kinase
MIIETGLERFGFFCGRTQCGHRQQKRAGVKPMRRISLATAWPSTPGTWMSSITTFGRLQQLLGNLALNAIKYGAPDAPVRVVVTGEARDVRFEVRNHAPAIERITLDRFFDPLQRGLNDEGSHNADGSLGLGLYIAREIAKAIGG